MDTNSSTNWIIGGVVAVVIIGLGWWLFMGRTSSTGTNATSTATSTVSGSTGTQTTSGGTVTAGTNTATGTGSTSTPGATTEADGEAVTVADQAAGASIVISSMNLSAPSWVAVRDDKSILGAGWFDASATSGTVPLIRGTLAGTTYTVLIYKDNGDRAFDFKADALVTGANDTFLAQ